MTANQDVRPMAKVYEVRGQYRGRWSAGADGVVPLTSADQIRQDFATEADALNFALAVVSRLGPGGHVVVQEYIDERHGRIMSIDDYRIVASAWLSLEGEWSACEEGRDISPR